MTENLPVLQSFQFQQQEIRTTTDKRGEPWFVAKDVCNVLEINNVSQAMTRLEDDEKSTLRNNEGGPEVNIINESGLYTLILRSNKPKAKDFRKWVTSEVLPSIRKTGKYEAHDNGFQSPRSMSEALKLAYEQALKIEEQEKAIETAAPKVNAFDTFMNAKGSQTIAEVAKALGKKMNTGPNRLFKTLREKGILMRNNLPKQEYIDCGYFEVIEKAFRKGNDPMMYAQTRVTPKGVDFISRAINGAVVSA